MSSKSSVSRNWPLILAATAATILVLWLIFGRSSKAPAPAPVPVPAPAPASLGSAAQAAMAAFRDANPEAFGQALGQAFDQVAERNDPAPSEFDMDGEAQSAPVGVMRANEYLTTANPNMQAWNSAALMPNPAASSAFDGPSFDQLSVFSGRNLIDATIAERYFMEAPQRKVVSLDSRPLPVIATSSPTVTFWNQSSLGVQDVIGGLNHYNSTYCSHNLNPNSPIVTPQGPYAGNPIQSSVQ